MENKIITEQLYQDLQFREQKYWFLFKKEIDFSKKVELLWKRWETFEKIDNIKQNYVLPTTKI